MNITVVYILLAILILVVIVGFGIILWELIKALKYFSPAPNLKPLHISLKKSSEYNLILSRKLYELKFTLNASKILITRFHNGGNYLNGMAMMKFSVYMETASELASCPIMCDNFRDVLNTRYPIAFSHLLSSWEEYICSDIDDCMDMNFKIDAKKCGFKSVNLFLIKQLNDTEEGFIGINYKDSHVMTSQERETVRNMLPTFRGLLNMVTEVE